MINELEANQNNIPVGNIPFNNYNSNEEIYPCKKYSKYLKFGFCIILLLNLILLFGTKIKLDSSDFSICQWPIFFKHQYYRIITHNFFHLGFVHIVFNMLFFFFISNNLENKLGSAYLLIFIFQSILLISIIYLLEIVILKYIVISLFKFTEYNFDFYCSLGFSGVLFALYYIQCNFRNISDTNTYFFGLVPVKARYSPLIYLLLVQVINPNNSLLTHISGILSGYILKNILIYFLIPGKESIEDFEEKFQFSLLERKFNYVQIKSIARVHHDLELAEINKSICDLSLYKYFKNIINQREERINIISSQNQNQNINSNSVSISHGIINNDLSIE